MSYERDEAMRQQEGTEAMIRMREPRRSSPHPHPEPVPTLEALERMWVNQPSTLQPLHALHGTNVLAAPESESLFRVWFLSGETISQQAPRSALSPGWR
jgi:hypothetical protein